MLIEANSKLVMIGDSITDCGRAQPVGEGRGEEYGRGYVALVNGFIGAVFPERNVRVVNMGTSGNTVRDLKVRWQRDVLEQQPDWLSIMIGINDVWRQFDLPLQKEIHVGLGEYRATLEELIKSTKPILKGLILMTPYFIEPSVTDPMRGMMDRYGEVVQVLAQKHGVIFVDTQAAFTNVLQHCHSAALAWDRVHPNMTGHMILAQAFLDAVQFNVK